METKPLITVRASVNAGIEKVWNYWNSPEHIVNWNNASEDWHTPKSEVDLREGGKFSATMAAKDGSFSFEFGGTYTKVVKHESIAYTMGDERKVAVHFKSNGQSTEITETFEAESQNSLEMQQAGWQAILNNFKKYCEEN